MGWRRGVPRCRITIEFDREHRILLVVVEGEYGDADMLQLLGALRTVVIELDPLAGITDLSLVTSFRVTNSTMRSAAAQPSPFKDPTPRFVVATADFAFGMFRMYQGMGANTRDALSLVRSREEAYAALGVRDPRFERVVSA
jgi:hypothetical protein